MCMHLPIYKPINSVSLVLNWMVDCDKSLITSLVPTSSFWLLAVWKNGGGGEGLEKVTCVVSGRHKGRHKDKKYLKILCWAPPPSCLSTWHHACDSFSQAFSLHFCSLQANQKLEAETAWERRYVITHVVWKSHTRTSDRIEWWSVNQLMSSEGL